MKKQFRQGDVFIQEISKKEANEKRGEAIARDRGRVVLAYGEVTGHAHAIKEEGVTLSQLGTEERLLHIFESSGGARLSHEEHATVEIPNGFYGVTIQREYVDEEIRNVAD